MIKTVSSLSKAIILNAFLYLMRRNQYRSKKLRQFFKTHYRIEVGDYSYGCFDQWRMPGPMIVGRYCSIAKTARTVLENHTYSTITTHPLIYDASFGVVAQSLGNGRPLIIEDDVWIGHGALILPGCKCIGRGAIIGAGSVVTKDVPAYVIMAGNPASAIKIRFSQNVIDVLEASKWWEYDIEKLKIAYDQNPILFDPLTVDNLDIITRCF